MSENFTNGIIGVALAVVGLATTAAIFSKSGKTSDVIKAGGDAFSNIIKAALGPVS